MFKEIYFVSIYGKIMLFRYFKEIVLNFRYMHIDLKLINLLDSLLEVVCSKHKELER
jgi:hypothetical protein